MGTSFFGWQSICEDESNPHADRAQPMRNRKSDPLGEHGLGILDRYVGGRIRQSVKPYRVRGWTPSQPPFSRFRPRASLSLARDFRHEGPFGLVTRRQKKSLMPTVMRRLIYGEMTATWGNYSAQDFCFHSQTLHFLPHLLRDKHPSYFSILSLSEDPDKRIGRGWVNCRKESGRDPTPSRLKGHSTLYCAVWFCLHRGES